MAIEYILPGTALLLLVSIMASKASVRLGVPVLVVFLLIGMLAGSDLEAGDTLLVLATPQALADVRASVLSHPAATLERSAENGAEASTRDNKDRKTRRTSPAVQ